MENNNLYHFSRGDIVLLSTPNHFISLNDNGTDIYAIASIDEKYAELDGLYKNDTSGKLAKIPIKDLLPVEINSRYDKNIYVDYIPMASYVEDGAPVPEHKADYTYYYESLNNCKTINNVSFRQLIDDRKFKYVHEIQHFLFHEFHNVFFLRIK